MSEGWISLPWMLDLAPRRPSAWGGYTEKMNSLHGAGGTEGGLGTFFIGFLMAIAGGYLLTSQVTVTSGYWQLWGRSAFGLSLLPFVIGIAVLFFDGKSVIGWILTISGALIILLGILSHLEIYFQPTSLFNTLVMLVLLLGGIGLVARSLRPYANVKE